MTVNNRLLQLAGFTGENADPGQVIFGDPLPTDDVEAVNVLEKELALGVVSKETAAKKRGYDYESEQERIANDKTSESNIGEALLSAFNRNQGAAV